MFFGGASFSGFFLVISLVFLERGPLYKFVIIANYGNHLILGLNNSFLNNVHLMKVWGN